MSLTTHTNARDELRQALARKRQSGRQTRVRLSVPDTPVHHWDPEIRAALRFGGATILLLLGVFLLWSAAAPLTAAVVGQGRLIAEGDRRLVQAPAQGIARRILVEDGSLVAAGAPLVEMDPAAQQAQWQKRLGEYYGVLLRIHRLRSEAAGAEALTRPAFMDESDLPPAVEAIFAEQQSLFQSRRVSLRLALAERAQEIARLRAGLQREAARQDNKAQQAALVADELVGLRQLFAKGYAAKSRLLEMERLQLELVSARDGAGAAITELREQIEAEQVAARRLTAERDREIASELATLTEQADALREALVEADLALERTMVTAPVGGRVMNLALTSEGAVVGSGETLLEIVPERGGLVAEASVPAREADQLRPGQTVTLRILSQPAYGAERLQGVLTYVDADAQVPAVGRGASQAAGAGPAAGEGMMRVQASFAAEGELAEQLRAGLPVVLFVETRSRSLLSYLLSPLMDFVARSLREG